MGKISLLSRAGVQQLQYLIFVLVVFHVFSCFITFSLGLAKVPLPCRTTKRSGHAQTHIGVDANPEIVVLDLMPNHPFFLVASDGVFEFLSSQTMVDMVVDFRFGKKLSGERTFTICGMADFLAPEIVQGRGHGLPADWWALGVLVYFMLQGEMSFGSWRQSELDTFAKIAKGQLTLPQTFSYEAVDLITKRVVALEVFDDKAKKKALKTLTCERHVGSQICGLLGI